MSEHLDAFAARLATLQTEGSLRLSELGGEAARRLQPLLDTGVLQVKKSGRGQRLEVVDHQTLARFIQGQYPEGVTAPRPASRADAVRRLRSAKRGGNPSQYSGMLVRVLQPNALAGPGLDGNTLHAITAAVGAVALVLGRQPECRCRGTVVTVENEDVFHQAEAMIPEADLVIYTAGRMSARLIEWLARQEQVEQVIHAGDYDPVGIREYLRLKEAMAHHVQLFMPADLETLFARHGDPAILRRESNQRAMSLVRASLDPAAQKVAALIDHYGAGLEQEVLLTH
ncbi:MAG: Wadjet anti-phage system protein JetD domain-containing protein [Aquisalimonadaceae bacterium]